ncbi:hypothetical protein [Nannocystis bainbridge]|uniref:Uncharacterized protein n=1 Tax=Nannocystis bainbridge TaxID=2995303 RepID=A0ABT5DSL7_9BACT|nr:hypothetical protein [Nannocystis bainbridge]MDC0716635.1 hypothetical protein [Nannocystis bainbridge]
MFAATSWWALSLVSALASGCSDDGAGQTATQASSPGTLTTLPGTLSDGTSTGTSTGAPTSTSTTSTGPGEDTLTTTTEAVTTGGPGGPKFDIGGGDLGGIDTDGCSFTPDANLTGTVYAPNLQLPISGALVYVTDGPVEPPVDGVFCSECVKLACDTPNTFTGPDGSFSLPAVSGPNQKLVMQKGQFLRVIDLAVAPGETALPVEQTHLPGQWNPDAGMWIPRIAVYDTDPDKVKNVLAKFGMGQVDGTGALIPGTESFTLVNDDSPTFLENLTEMNKYHIIFVPCATTKFWVGAPNVPDSRRENVKAYVAAGGKWYATDHSNEYIEAPFPDYQEFHAPAMPDIQPAYDSNGLVVDPEMLAWLQALPPALKDIGGGNPTLNNLPGILTRLNYSGIDTISPVIVQDMEGKDIDVGHHTWVEGPCGSCSNPQMIRPMAITGQYGCGRMMYSTFENSSDNHPGLNPQELVLLYMILEIGVCFDKPPPPPPPG